MVAGLGLLAALLAWRKTRWWPVAGLLVVAVPLLWLPAGAPTLSPYKALSQSLEVQGARRLYETAGPLGVLTVVESPQVPFRHAPGLSLASPAGPPDQLAVFTDGDGPTAVNRWRGGRDELVWLDYLTSALPYHLLQGPTVLVLGAGGGGDVLQALYHGARRIDAVELNPRLPEIVEEVFADYSGRPYSAPGVHLRVGEARAVLARSAERYDLIQVPALDAFGAASAGLYALNEGYLYTVEALRAYYAHLRPGGLVAMNRWTTLPPRDALKLFATARQALSEAGVPEPGASLAMIRSWNTATLLVKRGPFGAAELAALREFCATRAFDPVWYPGMPADEANRFNRLSAPEFFAGATALLGAGREDFLDRYKFHLRPATDDRPYFFRFFRWRTLPELWGMAGGGGLPWIEWGYPVLVATLVQAFALSLLLVLAPLLALRRQGGGRGGGQGGGLARIAAYFSALGLGFMFVEIAFIQKFTLFLGHPLYAVSVVLCSFLVFAGLGSRASERRARRLGEKAAAQRAVLWIAALALAYLVLLPLVFGLGITLAEPLRVALGVLMTAPLAYAMGMPFPLGLAATAAGRQSLLPWAWGINACSSVVGAVLAMLLAVHWGFSTLVGVALVLYLLAGGCFPAAGVEKGG